MGETRVVLDRDHPCLACGEPWLVREEARAFPHTFIVWKQRGDGQCSARCMTQDKDAYQRGLDERRKRGWMTLPTQADTTSGRTGVGQLT